MASHLVQPGLTTAHSVLTTVSTTTGPRRMVADFASCRRRKMCIPSTGVTRPRASDAASLPTVLARGGCVGWLFSVVVGTVYSGRAGREVGGCIDPIGGVGHGEGGSARVGDPCDSPPAPTSMLSPIWCRVLVLETRVTWREWPTRSWGAPGGDRRHGRGRRSGANSTVVSVRARPELG
jgi:hypothetical protein